MARATRIEAATTACVVTLSNPRFEDENGLPAPDAITMNADMLFNGFSEMLGDSVTFPRNATTANKNAAVRSRVNQIIGAFENGVTLNNSNIQIVGLPV